MSYTPYFLTVNGLVLDVTDAETTPDDVEAWGRGGGLAYTGVTYGGKRKVSFELAPLLPHDADAMEGWLKGKGHQWHFFWTDTSSTTTTRFSLYSADGGMAFAPLSSATLLPCATINDPWDGTDGFLLMLHPGNTVTATVTFGTDSGYSLSTWRRVNTIAASWELCSVTFDGATRRYFAGSDGATITTAFNWLAISSASGRGNFTLQGENNDSSNATALFCGTWIVPYTLSTAMLTARDQRAAGAEPREGAFPYVKVGGHLLRQPFELDMKGFLGKRSPARLSIAGNWYDNAEIVSGTLVQR